MSLPQNPDNVIGRHTEANLGFSKLLQFDSVNVHCFILFLVRRWLNVCRLGYNAPGQFGVEYRLHQAC